MYKNILFDIGNVLVILEHDRAFKKLAQYMNPLTAMLIWAKKDEFMKDIRREQDLLETGKMTTQQFFSRLKGKIGLKMNFEQFENAWCSMFSINENMIQMAQSLSLNYKVFLLSNTNESHINHLFNEFPVFNFISGSALSHELGYLKPAPEFFLKALENLDIKADESVFIDDSDVNVKAASETGLTSFKFENLGKLENDLINVGVKVA